MRLEQFLQDSARRFGGKTALIAGSFRLSHAELDTASDNLAAFLAAEGIARHDRIIIFMRNCAEAVIAIFAAQKAGCVFSLIHPATRFDRLNYIVGDSKARLIVTEDRLLPLAVKTAEQNASLAFILNKGNKTGESSKRVMPFEAAISAAGTPPSLPDTDLDLSALIYTSGTTGVPKGVMMTHRAMVFAERQIARYLAHDETDIILSALPLASSYGLNQVFLAISTGATLVLENGFAFPAAIFNSLKNHDITGFPLVPTMAALILQMDHVRPGDVPSLRYLTNAAAPLPVSHINRLQALFPDAAIYSMYGQTECRRGAYMPPHELHQRPGSTGIALPGTRAYVINDRGHPAAPHEVGELVIEGDHLMQGYWRDPGATNKALRPCPASGETRLHTGDLFQADEEGYLYFVARRDDLIKSRGEKVAPSEVEAVLHELPGVNEAVVIGIPDPLLGQALCAIVVATKDADLTKRSVIRHCTRRLEDFKAPREVLFYDELPKSGNGKINIRFLRESIAANLETAEEMVS